jgi:hypothetical protein
MKNPLPPAIVNRLALTLVLSGLTLCGCAPTSERLHPQFSDYRQPMAVMLVLEPEISIFEPLSDGSRLFQENQSRKAQRHARDDIVRQLRARHFAVRTADGSVMQTDEIMSIRSLFRSVNRSIQLHTFGPQVYPAKLKAFEYHLGAVAGVLEANDADALVLALGHQTGSGQSLNSWLSIAVVEPEGRVIWYGLQRGRQESQLCCADGMTELVGSTMARFWEQGS